MDEVTHTRRECAAIAKTTTHVERLRCRRIVELVLGGAAAQAAKRDESAVTELLDGLMMIALRAIDSQKPYDSVNDVVKKGPSDAPTA